MKKKILVTGFSLCLALGIALCPIKPITVQAAAVKAAEEMKEEVKEEIKEEVQASEEKEEYLEMVASAQAPGATTLSGVVSKDYRTLTLTWQRVTDASGYEVFRRAAGDTAYGRITDISGNSTTTYDHAGVTTGKNYYYYIRTYKLVNGQKVYGAISNIKGGRSIVSPPKFTVVGMIGGRNVTFSSTTPGAVIYYSTDTSALTTNHWSVANGGTIPFESFYGSVYAKAYYNGVWSNVSRLILRIPTVNTPQITVSERTARITTSTPNAYIYYTTDGSTPSVSNGRKLSGSSGTITCEPGAVVQAIAVRSCFSNSQVASAQVPYEGVAVTGTLKYDEAYEVLELLNALRSELGLSTLTMNEQLMDVAMLRAAECTVSFSHTRPNGSSCFSALPDDYPISCLGENIAWGYPDAESVMTGWTNSSGHYANMVNGSYNSVGIGCIQVNGRKAWVQFFSGNTSDSAVQPENEQTTITVEVAN